MKIIISLLNGKTQQNIQQQKGRKKKLLPKLNY